MRMSDGKTHHLKSRQDHSRESPEQRGKSKQGRPSATEWLVGGIATFLVLAGIGFLAYEAWHGTSSPPLLRVRAERILPQPAGGYVVEIVAENQGGTTARGLVVKGKLLGPGSVQVMETSTTTLSWVPAHADREGGLFFSHDPRQYRLEITPEGYDRP